jgi:hypothetical protein
MFFITAKISIYQLLKRQMGLALILDIWSSEKLRRSER